MRIIFFHREESIWSILASTEKTCKYWVVLSEHPLKTVPEEHTALLEQGKLTTMTIVELLDKVVQQGRKQWKGQ